ncbi:protoporphyrinogen oxidase [Cumulibacter soli]|uniref:protoporphyrinogen oxidase n=1 Tax=Cumulibacter soli TaxID=2546344 RepID=UPI0010681EEC|nr:protoporphyrinogen oxidase [Cumulibacter soli]
MGIDRERPLAEPPKSCDVLVIGAGIAGLVTAYRLRRARGDLDVHVIDIASYAGGKLRARSLAGVQVDVGAEAVIARRHEGMRLIEELGLSGEVHHPGVAASQIATAGGRYPIPAETLMGVPTDVTAIANSGLLSAAGIARLSAGGAPLEVDEDVSVGDAIAGEFGPEVVDRLVEPLLAGVYAGRADRLSLKATIPALWAQVGSSESLMAAAQAAKAAAPRSDAPVFATVTGGVGVIPDRLISAGDLSVTLRCPARKIRRDGNEFVVETGAAPDPHFVRARSVVVATSAPKAARLLTDLAPRASAELSQVATASMAVVLLAYRVGDLANPPPTTSGMLVPVSEGTTVKAATYVTNKWPHVRTSEDLFIVRASIGRVGDEGVLQRSDEDLVTLARRDLAVLGDISGEPIDSLVQRWGGGLPQYDVGHVARVARIRADVATVSGLAVAGATYDGVGIPGCINSADAAAQRVLQHIEGDE